MADLGIGPWGDEPTFHAPCFVVTHRPAETITKVGGTSYIFVTDGIEAALHRAQEAAGSQDVLVNGGADVARQFLNAGLLDQGRLTSCRWCWAPAPGCSTACARTSAGSRAKRSAAHWPRT